MLSAAGAPASKEPKKQFCIGTEKDPVNSSAGVLQCSANSAICRSNSTIALDAVPMQHGKREALTDPEFVRHEEERGLAVFLTSCCAEKNITSINLASKSTPPLVFASQVSTPSQSCLRPV